MTAKWGDIKVGEVISPVSGELTHGNTGLPIAGISTDSREELKGRIFFALRGEKFDGHDFALKAIEQGASCIVVDQGCRINLPSGANAAVITVQDTLKALGDLAAWWRHQFNVRVAVITGSAGKTTTKEMTARILELTSLTLKNKGNLNNLIGLPLTVFQLDEQVQKMVLEMGMNRPGEIRRLTEISDPDVGLITNVGMAHIEGLGSMEGVARAKTELLERISSRGRIILNGDDDLLMKEASRFNKDVITFGLRPENNIRAEKISNLGKDGISFELQYEGHAAQVHLPAPGLHNVHNALAAASIALAMGEPFDNVPTGLGRYDGLKGRFRTVLLADNITLVDDTYNSNPSSLKAALNSVKGLAVNGRRIILGLGEMLELGEETVQAHLDAGKMAADAGASWLFAMGDHSGEMTKGAKKMGLAAEKVVEVKTHEEMVSRIGDAAHAGDIILLKGSRRMGLETVAKGLEDKWPREV
jgi:UDP-N-acetylmuramoyl-tripeptide--D-alanyl-D-alanine ligase